MKITWALLLSVTAVPAIAQSTPASPELRERPVRIEQLGPDRTSPARKRDKEIVQRTIVALDNGSHYVELHDAHGRLLMVGTYADSALKIPHGLFTYYYPDGNMESSGLYDRGVKTGTWYRYAPDGTQKAEKTYGVGQ